MSTDDDRRHLLEIMAASWADLRAAIDAVRQRLDEPATILNAPENGDDWTVRDTVAHIATWERMAARGITGAPLPDGNDLADREPWDLDRFNDAMVLRWRARSTDAVFAELDAAHTALVAAVSAADPAACAPGAKVWNTIQADGAGHYPLHVPITQRLPED